MITPRLAAAHQTQQVGLLSSEYSEKRNPFESNDGQALLTEKTDSDQHPF